MITKQMGASAVQISMFTRTLVCVSVSRCDVSLGQSGGAFPEG